MRNPGSSLQDATRALTWPLVALLAVLVGVAACGDGTNPDDEDKGYSLDTTAPAKDTDYNFGIKDTAAPLPEDTSSVVIADAAAPIADSQTTNEVVDDPDSDGVDAGPVAIASCFGHCGIFLEDNACHCHHDCQAEGNCCKDFSAICACASKSDCDDGLFCTIDNCFGGLCKQIPLPANKCCDADAQCVGGDACNKGKCVEGTCQLVATDCDDGVACTVDVCAADSGECSHDIHPNKCLIDGLCAESDDAEPGSDGCRTCQPKTSSTAWQAKPGACFIDGSCALAGEGPKGSTGACRVCDPAQSAEAWTLITGTCFIDEQCYKSGQDHPLNPACALCSPSKSQTAWTGKPGKCAVDGLCYDDGDPAPGQANCGTCDAAKSTSSFTITKGSCLIEGACHSQGAKADGSFGCQICDTAKDQLAWTVAKGQTCDDDDPCTVDTICLANGSCKGKPKGACCKTNGDCAGTPVEDCQESICNTVAGACQIKAIEACCTDGVCCDKIKQTPFPASTKCSDFAIGSSQYKCEGDVASKRKLYPGCDGINSNKCSQLNPAAGEWTVYKTCSKGQLCQLASQTSAPTCK